MVQDFGPSASTSPISHTSHSPLPTTCIKQLISINTQHTTLCIPSSLSLSLSSTHFLHSVHICLSNYSCVCPIWCLFVFLIFLVDFVSSILHSQCSISLFFLSFLYHHISYSLSKRSFFHSHTTFLYFYSSPFISHYVVSLHFISLYKSLGCPFHHCCHNIHLSNLSSLIHSYNINIQNLNSSLDIPINYLFE